MSTANTDFIIRFAAPADAEAIADISRSTFYDTFGAHNTKENMDLFMTEQFSRGQLIKEVGAAKNIFLVASKGQDIIAYACMREERLK